MSLSEYFIKFSCAVAVVYLFYRIVLRPLTFYQWNRMYLLCFSVLSFVLPFININTWITGKGMEPIRVVQNIPMVTEYIPDSAPSVMTFTEGLWIVFLAGVIAGAARVLLQVYSFCKMRRNAVLLYKNESMRLYDVRCNGAFSFGDSIYVNTSLHSENDLRRIILHEIIHVRQQHTIDLLLSELICILLWYNPFAWMLRKAVRQNLEFIADSNVLSKGYDAKEYQYLLLKVAGVSHFSVANHFSISDLKKRIIMMNKITSARVHLTKFLIALPVLAIVLV